MEGPVDLARAEAKARFGFQTLRPYQADVLGAVLEGRDALAVLPTGAGKSLCYALPAALRPGLVLVISPLIALIRDQERRFLEQGIAAGALDSHRSRDEKERVWEKLDRGELKLLLVSPERLARVDFRARLAGARVQLVAVDEAHCVSHWGSHFRPDYRFLGEYVHDIGARHPAGRVQKLALTATATQRVRADVVQGLGLVDPVLVVAPFARENLKIKVARADKVHDQLTAVLQAVKSLPGSGIVYAPTRKQAQEIHRVLANAGESVALYHAGLSSDARQYAQRAFMTGESRVVVATNAFGLGIDKADIRFVVHAGLPSNLEQYVQEIGRAGRDGEPATCMMIYSSRDFHVQKFMLDKSHPEPAQLQTVLRHARSVLGGMGAHAARSEDGLVHEVASMIDVSDADIRAGLDLLCREGLLSRLRASESFSRESLIEDGSPRLDEDFWRDYPLRKQDALAKLEAMRAFAAAEDRERFLGDYFRT